MYMDVIDMLVCTLLHLILAIQTDYIYHTKTFIDVC